MKILLCRILSNLHYEKFLDGSVKCIEDEIPFEVPKGWEWERLSNIASFASGKTPSTSYTEFWNGNVPWVTSKDMKSKYITCSQLYLSELGASQMHMYQPNTLLMVTRSGILRHTLPLAILKKSATINQDLKAISIYSDGLSEYVYICLKGMEIQLLSKYTKSGTTVENINFDEFKRLLLPIAPEPQIRKIVSITNDSVLLIKSIESTKMDLADIISKVRTKILDLAIRGQLVPQNPIDEPASILLNRIRSEKENLIKQGKIKRDKKESIIFRGDDNSYYRDDENAIIDISDELPFIIPDSWCWGKLKDIVIINPRNKLADDTEVSFIPMPLIEDGYSGRHTSELASLKSLHVLKTKNQLFSKIFVTVMAQEQQNSTYCVHIRILFYRNIY